MAKIGGKQLPVRRVQAAPGSPPRGDAWPWTMPCVRQLLRDGLDLGPLTILVGEVGSGKSTLVEAIAMAYGLAPEGGSTGARHRSRETESTLHDDLLLVRGAGASKWGYFVRAETMHGLFSYLEDHPSPRYEPHFHALSHGQSFAALIGTRRFEGQGLFVFDEPEAGLSFGAQLELVASIAEMTARPGTQVVMATHSPVLASVPGGRILELGPDGYEVREWTDLEVVDHYRRYLDDPRRYLRHLLG